MLVKLSKVVEVNFRLLGTNGFRVKAKNERFTTAGSPCCLNLKYEKFMSSFGKLGKKNCTKKRAARAGRLFFLIQPIIPLICGVVVAVAVVIS